MPIKPENRSRYPANWKEIADSIRARAENRCEKCMVRNGETVSRGQLSDGRHIYLLESGNGYCAETGEFIGQYRYFELGILKHVKIVLTVAHLDHTPENCDPENLRAWCQRCHLRYDKKHHAVTAYAAKKAMTNTVDMFRDDSRP